MELLCMASYCHKGHSISINNAHKMAHELCSYTENEKNPSFKYVRILEI